MLRVIAISALLVGLTPGVARGALWQWPVSGRIVGSFSFSPDAPYAAGQRRGIVLAAAAGAPVRSVCAGRVAFAGAVGRAGPTVSVQCGGLRATYQGLGEIRVAQSAAVAAGDHIARVGPLGALRLGARKGPAAYVDPATLLTDRAPPLGPAPRAVRPGPAPPPVVRGPSALPRVRPTPRARLVQPTPPGPGSVTPRLAWIGLAALAGAMPLGALVRGRARRRHTAGQAVSSAA